MEMEKMNNEQMEQEQTVAERKSAESSFSKLGFMFLIGTAVIYAVQYLAAWGVKAWKPEWLADPTISLMVTILPMYLVGIPALVYFVKKIPGTAPAQHSMKKGHLVLAFIMCYAIMYGSNLIGTVITTVIGLIKGSAVDNAILNVATSANMAVTFIYMVICAPFIEEYVFRKLIVDRTARFGQGVAVVVSGVMFGLFHGNLSQFVYATTLGMFFAFIYVKTGKLKYSIILHMVINFMGAIVSVLVLKGIHMDEYMQVVATGDVDALMAFVMNYLPGWIAYLFYLLFVMIVFVTGVILLIVFHKRFVLEKGEVSIPKGKRFATIFLNFGMLVYSLFWIGMMIVQLIQ